MASGSCRAGSVLAALTTANGKTLLALVSALALGIMCKCTGKSNRWMSYSARTTVDRLFTIVPPIAAFVYSSRWGLFIKAGAPESFWASIGDTAAVTWGNFFVGNLLPVTIGNMIGDSIMAAAIYWFVYPRKQ
jgi:formate transporter